MASNIVYMTYNLWIDLIMPYINDIPDLLKLAMTNNFFKYIFDILKIRAASFKGRLAFWRNNMQALKYPV